MLSGLTPKYRDVATLVDMLTYVCVSSSSQLLLRPRILDDHTLFYTPPDPSVTEFEMSRTLVHPHASLQLKGMEGHAIAFVLQGNSGSQSSRMRRKRKKKKKKKNNNNKKKKKKKGV